jgi:hypothetical protein
MRKPNFFIVGAPRCGTTALKEYLAQHPDIFMPPSNVEPHFFGTDLYSPKFVRDEQSYLSLFDGATDEKRLGEKSASYLYSKRAAAEIKAYQLSASIIIMLRNPLDLVYSLHRLRLYDGREHLIDLGDALDAEKDRRRGVRMPASVSVLEKWRYIYRDLVKYAEQVQRYLDTFGWENVHIIIFDDLTRDTADVYRDTLRFLDVNPEFQPEFRKVNPSRSPRNRNLHKLVIAPPEVLQSFVRAVMPSQLRLRLGRGIKNLNTNYEPRPPLNPELKKKLQSEFLPEVERLSELLGRDLTHWCQT